MPVSEHAQSTDLNLFIQIFTFVNKHVYYPEIFETGQVGLIFYIILE
jgi:hypothetical protein